MDMNIIEIFTLPFMQRAIIGGILIATLTSWMGTLVVLRRSSFYGDAIAHSSLTGVALGLLLGINPVLVAGIYAILISLMLPYLQKHSNLPTDSLLGFVLPFSMGLGVIVLSTIPGYQPDLISFLFGSVLAIGWADIAVMSGFAILAWIIITKLGKQLISASFDAEYAKISGISVDKINIIFNILLAITIVAGVKLIGIILVNALLVIPASTSRLFATSLKQMFTVTPIIALLITIGGLIMSYTFNFPSGPTMAVVAGITFLGGLLIKKFS